MNIGVIFAGGVGKRMNSRVKPKQFIDVYGKPIIIHTLELFENHPEIDAIAVACLEDWIPYLQELLEKFNIKKVKKVVPGGASGQESIYNGLKAAEEIAAGEKSIVLIHDGVRPLINEKTITDNIESVKKYGSSITCVKVKETVLVVGEDNSIEEFQTVKTHVWHVHHRAFIWMKSLEHTARQWRKINMTLSIPAL